MRLSLLALSFAAALVRAGWLRNGPAPSDHPLELKIALPQPHFPILEKHLWEVSNPKHERYGAYLSKEETEALMAPHPETLDVVSEWLSSHGIEEEHLYRSSAQDWITIRIPVVPCRGNAEHSKEHGSFSTLIYPNGRIQKYHVYTHSDSGESIVRTTSYSLPESLDEHVELIQPTTMFTRLKPFKSTLHWSNLASSGSPSPSTGTLTGPAGNPVDASCNGTITITCLRQLYNAVGYNTSATNDNKIAVTAYLEQYANNQDLQQFFQLENPTAYGSNYTFVSINGGLNNQTYAAAGIEANLDTQFAYGLTYPTPATFYSTGGSPPYIPDAVTPTDTNEPYLNWLDYVSSQEYLPQTISTSYGDDEQTVPYTYATRVCGGFAALGVRGISLLFSSGDGGVGDGDADPATQKCFANTGTNRTVFLPEFPAACPYVTSVGGTNYIPETAVFFSGGGFSNYFPRPDYQEVTVSKYLQTLTPGTYEGLYNPYGRGIPDVAAQAWNFLIVYQGQTGYVAGTSCSSPTFASFVSMLNDARLSAGKPALGFLNPWLYETGYAGLNDITVGNNPGCGTEGFNATFGWDPVTGLGTPNFEKLLALAMAA
ncbi:peptidase S8/S53 domain-containing protein [Lanmaoa asiatica]|nr:peptidase S8/S53 domain-containing protein [Lanmaoa asiatica]